MNKSKRNSSNAWDNSASDFLKNRSENVSVFKKYIDTPELLKLIKSKIKNKNVVDVGCGNGDLCRRLYDLGANITGIDGSKTMLKEAQKNFSNCKYIHSNLNTEQMPFRSSSVDIVIAKLFLMYIPHINNLSREVFRVLTKRGLFLVDIIHPLFPFLKSKMKIPGKYEIDYNYFSEVKGKVNFNGKKLTYYYRPINYYVNNVIEAGFKLIKVTEPEVKWSFIERYPFEEKKLNLPITLHLLFEK